MNIERAGNWLNLTANVAVVAGIIFLALEVRNSAHASEMQMQEAVADGFNSLAMAVASDPELARIFVIGLYEPNRLSDVEAIQFAMFLRAYLNQQNRVFNLKQLGVMQASDWRLSAEELGSMMSTPGGQLYMRKNHDMSADLVTAMQPYLNRKPKWDLMLGRDISQLD